MVKITKKVLKQFVKNEVCEIPILYNCCNIAFSVAEEFRARICVPCWYDCREIFHADYPKPNHVFINHRKYGHLKIKNFIKSMELELNLSRKSKVYKAVKKTASVVVLSSYWKNPCLFGLFTLIVRTAAYHQMSLFDRNIIQKCKYLYETRNAFNILFDGRGTYTGSNTSWYKQFRRKTVAECKKYLK